MPKLNEVIAEVKRNRVLLIIDPATKMPPEQLDAFFAELTEKNNLLVLTGDKTQMASIEQAARKSFASQLKAKKLASPRWTTGDNKVDRMLGKELCVLAWARTAGSCVLEFWRARNCLNASTRAGRPFA